MVWGVVIKLVAEWNQSGLISPSGRVIAVIERFYIGYYLFILANYFNSSFSIVMDRSIVLYGCNNHAPLLNLFDVTLKKLGMLNANSSYSFYLSLFLSDCQFFCVVQLKAK